MRITHTLVALALLPSTAHAWPHHPPPLDGSFFGTTVQNHIDLDGDGLNGRSGTLRARDGRFAYIDVNLDSTFADWSNPQGGCPSGSFEIIASGQAALVSLDGDDVLFIEVDSSQPFCTSAPETVLAFVVGGRGRYAGDTGTATFTLPDDLILNADASGFPRVVYTHDASYSIDLD